MERMYCKNCGSEDILLDADLRWDVEKQEWRVNQVYFEGTWCDGCEEQGVKVMREEQG